jgi:hypothetical protein
MLTIHRFRGTIEKTSLEGFDVNQHVGVVDVDSAR